MTWQFTLTGLLIGVLVGLTGMGGGALLTPILVIVFGFKPTYAVGTDLLHGAVFKSFGAVRHRQLGTVHARLALWMLVGSIPGVLLGSHLSIHVPDRGLRIGFAFILLLSGIKLLEVPKASIIIVAGLVVAAVALAVYGARVLAGRRVAPAAD